jgi:hypothetical protein
LRRYRDFPFRRDDFIVFLISEAPLTAAVVSMPFVVVGCVLSMTL